MCLAKHQLGRRRSELEIVSSHLISTIFEGQIYWNFLKSPVDLYNWYENF